MEVVRGALKLGIMGYGAATMSFGVAQGVENIHEMRNRSDAVFSDEFRRRTPERLGPTYSAIDYGAAILRNTGGIVEGVFDPGDPDPSHAFSHNVLVVIGGWAALRLGARL